MATIIASPGVTNSYPVINLKVSGDTAGLDIPMMQDITINNSNDTFTWTQLNETAKLQVATTATNSVSGTLVVDDAVFFGATAAGEGAQTSGLIGLSTDKTEVAFEINVGSKTISGVAYVTGLAPTVSADSPVWTTPITLSVSGEYTIA